MGRFLNVDAHVSPGKPPGYKIKSSFLKIWCCLESPGMVPFLIGRFFQLTFNPTLLCSGFKLHQTREGITVT